MATHNSTWRTLLNTIFHDVLQECELWVNFGEKSGDSEWRGKDSAIGRNSGADELIAFHMNIGKQFFMIASSVNLSLSFLREIKSTFALLLCTACSEC